MAGITDRRALHIARLLESRRADLGLTLEEACRRASALGTPIHVPTLWRIEKGRLDPGVRRLTVLLDVYGIEPDLASELTTLQATVEELPTGDVVALHEEAKLAWNRGDLPWTLACTFSILLRVA